jgi:hypothetical protein
MRMEYEKRARGDVLFSFLSLTLTEIGAHACIYGYNVWVFWSNID